MVAGEAVGALAFIESLETSGGQIEYSQMCRVPLPGARVYAVRYDWQPSWWGSWGVVGLTRTHQVEWQATIIGDNSIRSRQGSPIEVTEQSIDSVQALRLDGMSNPFIEVIGTTHMGHGNLYLYELDAARRELRLVLCTFVLDRHDDETLILDGGVLDRAYRDLDGNGYADLEVSGKVVVRPEGDAGIGQPVDLRRCFLWSPTSGRFQEDQKDQRGFDRTYPGRD